MSVHVATELKTKPGRTDELVATLSRVLPESLDHDGREAISLRKDQDDPTKIVSFTQWATRRHYEDYLAWRTEAGMTDEVGEMLTEPMSIRYFDEIITVTEVMSVGSHLRVVGGHCHRHGRHGGSAAAEQVQHASQRSQ